MSNVYICQHGRFQNVAKSYGWSLKKNTTDDPRDEAYQNPWKITPIECTPIHLAISNGHFDLTTFLLICGADFNIPYKEGKTKTIKTDEWIKSIKRKSETLVKTTYSEMLILEMTKGLDMKTSIESMSREFQVKIDKTLDKIQDLGWNFNTCRFPEISKILKSF